MIDSYYALLGVARDTPSWKLAKDLYRIADELKEAYGGEGRVPDIFGRAISTLLNQDQRAVYDALLAYATSGQAVDVDVELKRLVANADDAFHFELEEAGGGHARVLNRGVPAPPNPAPPGAQAERELGGGRAEEAKESEPPPRPSGPCPYGRVNGRIPPLSLGPKVFNIEFADDCYLEGYNRVGDRTVTQWAQQTDTGLKRIGFADYLEPCYGDDSHCKGERHFIMMMRDVETDVAYKALTYNAERGDAGPKFVSCGVWDLFPWWWQYHMQTSNPLQPWKIEYMWERDHPGREMPPRTYFGADGWAPITTHAFLTFIEESVYWSVGYRSGWEYSPDQARQFARETVLATCWYLVPFKPRYRKKLGLPHKKPK
jgi:hypothetical protein